MKRIRFLHAADLHIDTPFKGLGMLAPPILKRVHESTFHAVRRMINYAIRERVHFLVLAGDLYDGHNRSIRAQAFLKKEFERLNDAKINVYIIHGNHDHLSGSWVHLGWPNNVHFFEDKVEEKILRIDDGEINISIQGFSYPKREIYINQLEHFRKRNDQNDFYIGVLHGQADGIEGHSPYAPFKIEQLLNKQYDYWALGHIHKQMELHSTIFYPGNIQGRNRKEIGEKGCLLVDIVENRTPTVQFVPLADVIWKQERMSIHEIDSTEEFVQKCEEMLEQQRQSQAGVLLEILLTGQGEVSSFIKQASHIEELIEHFRAEEEKKKNFVWLTGLIDETKNSVDIDNIVSRNDFLSDIIRASEQILEEKDKQFLVELFEHRRGKKFLEQLSDDEFNNVVNEARELVLLELLKEWEA